MIAAIGWIGSALVVLSLTQRDVRRLRQVNLAASAALGVFNIALGIVSMIALNAVLAAVNAYHLLHRPEAHAPEASQEPARAHRASGLEPSSEPETVRARSEVAAGRPSCSTLLT